MKNLAKEIMQLHAAEIKEIKNKMQVQIFCTHALMDLGFDDYKDAGFKIGEYIWGEMKHV